MPMDQSTPQERAPLRIDLAEARAELAEQRLTGPLSTAIDAVLLAEPGDEGPQRAEDWYRVVTAITADQPDEIAACLFTLLERSFTALTHDDLEHAIDRVKADRARR